MPILKNKTKNNFTMINNNVFRDRELSMKDRGVLCTICSLPDGWDFSIAGLSAVVPDGIDSIRNSVISLENMGYMKRTKTRDKDGRYVSEIEVFTERQSMLDLPSREIRNGKIDADNPLRLDHGGLPKTDNTAKYNTDNKKINIKNNNQSINQSKESDSNDTGMEIDTYKNLIAENIKLSWLIESAGDDKEERSMVAEIYDVICDMVCYPRENVEIKGIKYPWNVVKSQFLKLKHEHIASILNRLIDAKLGIKNMSAYLISTLYTESLVGTLESQAELHDEYLKQLRGKPY